MRQLDGPRRRIQVYAEHQRNRTRDRRRADSNNRAGESLRRLGVAVEESPARQGGERLSHSLGACSIAVIEDDDRGQPRRGAEHADNGGERHDRADGGVGPAGGDARGTIAGELGGGEGREHPSGRSDRGGVEHARQRLGDHGQARDRGRARDRAGVESHPSVAIMIGSGAR